MWSTDVGQPDDLRGTKNWGFGDVSRGCFSANLGCLGLRMVIRTVAKLLITKNKNKRDE